MRYQRGHRQGIKEASGNIKDDESDVPMTLIKELKKNVFPARVCNPEGSEGEGTGSELEGDFGECWKGVGGRVAGEGSVRGRKVMEEGRMDEDREDEWMRKWRCRSEVPRRKMRRLGKVWSGQGE